MSTMIITVGLLCVILLAGVYGDIKPRRTDITDWGYGHLFRGWVDVQGQGENNDYCRVVGPSNTIPHRWLSCALAGTEGDSQYNYNAANAGSDWFDQGYSGTWYMRDENDDNRDDYCRCVGNPGSKWISCMLADRFGFQSKQYGFSVPNKAGC